MQTPPADAGPKPVSLSHVLISNCTIRYCSKMDQNPLQSLSEEALTLLQTEVVNVPPPYQPVRAFEIGDIAKLSILNHHNSRTGILVKIDNHALPYPGMSWQYSIRADSVIPSGQGVLWIDEKNFEKVTPLNVPRGARLDYLRNGVMMHGFITNANSSKDGELLYEVQQVCSANVAAKDVLRVVNFGFGDRDGI